VITPEHLDLEHASPAMQGRGPAGRDVAAMVRDAVPLKTALAQLEREMIKEALHQAEGNRSEAARALHIYRRLLYQKMEEYELE
jgi:DNA-binding NtrC family response regulator